MRDRGNKTMKYIGEVTMINGFPGIENERRKNILKPRAPTDIEVPEKVITAKKYSRRSSRSNRRHRLG
ncbi:hypothetical protein ODV97_19435 [Enterococcus gallinarum]|nr:hypothetical protein [Enterococcus gallinarum]